MAALTQGYRYRPGAVLLTLALAAAASSQVQTLPAAKATAPIRLDGNLQAPGWENAKASGEFQDIFTGKPTLDQTQAWLTYDDQSIYVAFYCHDSRPDQIVGREITPESQFNGEDTVTFEIDTFNTRSYASISRFTVNAINTRTESIAGGRASKAEWRGIWFSSVHRVQDGFIVQMRIPWRILNYPSSDKPLNMDIDFDRYQQRTKTNSQWANTTTAGRPELLGIWKGVQPPRTPSRPRPKFLMYDAPELVDGKFANRLGLDARYPVSGQQTALLSISPDFENIEQQIAGINFVHTERFLNDARPFFTEGGQFFNPISQFQYAIPFYSEQIGQINAGAKFYGQLSKEEQLGVLAVNEPGGVDASFGNYQLNKGSTFSTNLYGSTYDGLGLHDRMGGTAIAKRWGNVFVNGAGALEDTGSSTESAGNVAVGYSGPKLFSEVQQEWVDPSFDPPLAYVPWQDRRGYYTYTNYGDTIAKGPIHDFDFSLYTPDFYQADRTIQERGTQLYLFATTRKDESINVGRSITDYAGGSDDFYDLSYGINASNRFKQASVEYLFGRQSGDPSRYLDVKGSLRVLRNIDLGLEQSVLVFATDARQTIGTIGWQIDARQSITGRFVETNGDQNFFLAYSSSGWTGAEMYVIIGDPNATTFSHRISLKFVWAF